jgi:PAS domain S-box-containing protein
MDLRTKLLLGIGIALIAAFTVVALFSAVSMESSYRALEKVEMEDSAATTMNALTTDVKTTYSIARDYSAWGETYRFAEGENPGWVSENMGPDFFSRFSMDQVLVFNRTGDLIFAMQYNESTVRIEPVPGTLVEDINRFHMAVDTIRSGNGNSGLLEATGGPVLIASHPILTDQFSGPPSGSLHLTRKVDDAYLADLSVRTGNTVSVVPAAEVFGNASLAGIASQFSAGAPVAVQPENQDRVSAYIPLKDQEPPVDYYLKVSKPRTIYNTGMSGIATFLVSLAIAGIFIILFVLLFIDRIVLSRINAIIRAVKAKKAEDNIPGQAVSNGEDELTRLAVTIDPVFAQLAESKERIIESEERYRTLAESAQDLIFIIDRDDRVVYINTFAAQSFGISQDEIIGKLRSTLFTGPVGERQRESLNRVFSTGDPIKIEGDLPLPKGAIWHDTLLVPIRDSQGTISRVMGISRDITKRKRAEEALSNVNKKLNLLSTITRHDILNQLTALATYLELSRDYAENDTLRDFIAKEQQIAAIIDREINFTRDYQELGESVPVWHNVAATIAAASRPHITGKVKIVTSLSAIEIFADPLLEKVFFNLIDNALRYGGPGISEIRFSSRRAGAALVIICEDDGAGIRPEEKEQIFEQGFGNHTGLGLFLSREILGITNITIAETGTFGEGARFEITVPEGMYRFTEREPVGGS